MSAEAEEIQKLAAFLQAHGVADYIDQAERYVRRYADADGGLERMWRHCRQKFGGEAASAESGTGSPSTPLPGRVQLPKGAVEIAVLTKIYQRIAPDRASGAAAVVERRIDDPGAMAEMWAALCAKYNLTMDDLQAEMRATRAAMEGASPSPATLDSAGSPSGALGGPPLEPSVVEARLIAYLLTVAPDRARESSMLLAKLQTLPGGLAPANVARLMTSLEGRFGVPEPAWDSTEGGAVLLEDMRGLRDILQAAFQPATLDAPVPLMTHARESARQIDVMYSNSALSLDAAGRRAPEPDYSAFYRSAKYAQAEVQASKGLTPEAAAFWRDRLTSLISRFAPRVAERGAAAILTRCERPLPRAFAGPLPRPAAELVELAAASLEKYYRDAAPPPDFVARFLPNPEDLPLEAATAFPIEYALRDPLHSPLAVARLVGRQTLAGAVNADPMEADPTLRPAPPAKSVNALVAAPARETFAMLAHRTANVSLGASTDATPTAREVLHGSFGIVGLPVGALQDLSGDERLSTFVEALGDDVRDIFGRLGLSGAVVIQDLVTAASGAVRALWTVEFTAGTDAATGATWLRSKLPREKTLPIPKSRVSLVRDLGLAPAPLFIGSMEYEYFGARRAVVAADDRHEGPDAAETLIYAPMSAHVSPHRRTANGPIIMPRPPLSF